MNSTPRAASRMSRTIAGRSGPIACASVGQRNPGAISSVIAPPPTMARRSSTSGLQPGFREVVGGGEAVVAGADDEDHVSVRS